MIIDFYSEVLGAEPQGEPYIDDTGRIGHAELRIGGSRLFLADEHPEIGVLSPTTVGGFTVSLVVQVPDVDAAFERALQRGARVDRPVQDGRYGSRSGWLFDPFGHRWNVGTPER